MEGDGVQALEIPELEAAFADYVPVVDERVALTKKEVPAKQKVLDLMHANHEKLPKDKKGRLYYVYDDAKYVLVAKKESITRSKIKDPTDDEDEDESED